MTAVYKDSMRLHLLVNMLEYDRHISDVCFYVRITVTGVAHTSQSQYFYEMRRVLIHMVPEK